MSNSAALKSIATGTNAVAEQPRSLAARITAASFKEQLRLALPRTMTADRMARIVLTELRKTPKLQECEPASFMGAVLQCAQLGLEPGGALGHAYLLPFEKRGKRNGEWCTVGVEAQVIIGYRGMIDLARRSGQIVSIDARAVYEGDKFECAFGLDSRLEHVPNWEDVDRTAKPLRFVYAVAKLKDGGVQYEVMSRAEIEAVRGRSKAAQSGPWTTDFVPMALKTVIRRLFKYLPVSVEVQRAVALDERQEAGLSQELEDVLDADARVVDDPALAAPPAAEEAGAAA